MSSTQNGHAMPPPSGQSAQNSRQNRPRSKSNFSFRSVKSHKSEGSAGKIEYSKADLQESHNEKAAKRLTSKADPTLAMSEAEPSAIANSMGTRLAPLRAIQHKDAVGNVIDEPDRSNPTRSRWERPLDTIRAFEAAIDGNYRESLRRSESTPSVYQGNSTHSRRTSYAGNGPSSSYQRESYYGGRSQHRPDSYFDESHRQGSMQNGYQPSRARFPRNASEPMVPQAVYPAHGNHHSFETVNSASNSGASYVEPAGYSTDPSSENSSIDRMHADGYNSGNYEAGSHVPRAYQQSMPMIQEGQQPSYSSQTPQAAARQPIKLGTSSDAESKAPQFYEAPKIGKEKRKSWLGRKLSKRG